MPASLDENSVRSLIMHAADRIIENRPLLTEIDSKIGDGDHGIGMAGGMQKAKEAVSRAKNSGSVWDLFDKAGRAMLMSMGGASGVIFGTLYMAGAAGAEPRAELSPEDFTRMMEKSLAAIKERGKARLGDKTMVDALEPAVEALKKHRAAGFVPMLKAAAEAARAGVENTKNYRAQFGRAKSLMERAVGFQDPGATSVWIIFQAMYEFVEQLP